MFKLVLFFNGAFLIDKTIIFSHLNFCDRDLKMEKPGSPKRRQPK
jgi:hypothetical protein